MQTLADMLMQMNSAQPWIAPSNPRRRQQSPKRTKGESRYARICAFIEAHGPATLAEICAHCEGEGRASVKSTVAQLVTMRRIRNLHGRGPGLKARYALP